MFLRKGVLKICSKFTRKRPCRNVISIMLLCSFIENTLQHGCSPVNLLHIFRTLSLKNTLTRLLLDFCASKARKKWKGEELGTKKNGSDAGRNGFQQLNFFLFTSVFKWLFMLTMLSTKLCL